MEKDKKKRSPNFTNEEKENLLSLVAKFKGVVECKKTGAFYLHKKKEAWVAITKHYNSLSTTGPRDEDMLKHFYNNVKHRARKVSASKNKQRYLNELESKNLESMSTIDKNEQETDSSNFSTIGDNASTLDENAIQGLKKKWADKKSIKKTGGGPYNPILTEADHQVMAILDDQIRPDQNPFDDAAEYFGDTIEEFVVEDPLLVDSQDTIEVPVESPKKTKNTLRFNKKRTNKVTPPECMRKSAEMLMKIYFKKKIELLFYQKNNEMQKFRNERKNHENQQKRHELEMKILKKQLEKAERDLK